MVDFELRNSLLRQLRQLLSGTEVCQFDDAFYFRFSSTEDRGVREIALLCHSLFTTFPEPGGNQECAVVKSDGMSTLLDRSILFLQSDLEYEWPAESLSIGRRAIAGLILFLIVPVLMALLAYSLPLELVADPIFGFFFAMISVAILYGSLLLIAMKPAPVELRSKKILLRGDYEVWPFYRRGDLALANRPF